MTVNQRDCESTAEVSQCDCASEEEAYQNTPGRHHMGYYADKIWEAMPKRVKKVLNATLPLVSFALFVIALRTIWGWHAVPLGAPEIGIWQALGLLALRSLVVSNSSYTEYCAFMSANQEDIAKYRFYARVGGLMATGVCILMAWIAK